MHLLWFQPEVILYVYLASCIAVLIFNILYIFGDKFQGKLFEKQSLTMVDTIALQMKHLEEKESAEADHIQMLSRDLRKLRNLRVFEKSLEEAALSASDHSQGLYVKGLRGVFIALSAVYEKRDSVEMAYFASLIAKFGVDQGHTTYDGLMESLNSMVIKKDVYVRENALKALYRIGNKEAVFAAWEKMQANEIYHSVKLLSDGLLSFTGDKPGLAKLLFKHWEEFDARLVLPVMQFIRFFADCFQEQFFRILEKETVEKELRLESIRYFRRYPYEPARQMIQSLLRYQEFVDWEFAAMAALALVSYPGADTVLCLKEGLKASNWYVRLNCAETLVHGLKIPRLQLFDVYNENDRYAREILQYISEKEELEEIYV